MSPLWLTAFLDLGPDAYDDTVAFWAGVTGYRPSAPRGEQGQFTTLDPPQGTGFLRAQRIPHAQPRLHLDLHVADIPPERERLVELGASLVDQPYPDVAILRSPGGLVFCLVSGDHEGGDRPPPHRWPAGHTSLVDQVCLDIPPAAYTAECAFWTLATGWELRHHPPSEFSNLARPEGMPLRLLLQRRDDGEGPVSAHLDLSTSDRACEVARHQELGATVVGPGRVWTVLRDPAGSAYCITDRDPETGMLW